MKPRFEGELYILNERMLSFPERLKKMIGDSSVRSFARRSNIAESAIRQYLKGASEPTLGNLLAMSYVSKVSINWLVCGDDELNTEEEVNSNISNQWQNILKTISEEDSKTALKNIINKGFKSLLVDIDNKPLEISADNVKELTAELIKKLNYEDLTEVISTARAVAVAKAIDEKPKTKTA